MKNKRAQEEMVGFVIIMLLVAVIFLVFLGIFLRKGGLSSIENGEAAQFLDALEEVTTECKIGFSYLNERQLVKKCYERDMCEPTADGERDSCKILEKAVENAIESSWNFNTDSYIKAYRFEARYEHKSGSAPDYFLNRAAVSRGVCSEQFRGAEKAISVSDGIIFVKLNLCY